LNKITILLWVTFSIGVNAQVTLGPTVDTFEVLAGSTVTNTGATVVSGGNVGVSPGSAITGFPPGSVSGGVLHAADAAAAQAQSELTTAYGVASGLACPGGNNLTGQNLGGLILTPGVYCFSTSAQLTGILTLNALGNQNAEFIFQIGSTLTTASGSSIVLINNAQAGNVFWQLGSSATLGTTTVFAGNILAQSSITLTTGATLNGRALARTGAVTLDTNTFNAPAGTGGNGGGNGPPATPAPSSLILVGLALACVGIYQMRFCAKRS
jgi:hypothetical protein